MNRAVKSGLFACALAACAIHPILAQEEAKDYPGAPDPKSYGYTVLALGIGTPFALPWGFDWDVFGLDVNVVYGDCNKMYGLEAAAVGSTAALSTGRSSPGISTSIRTFPRKSKYVIGVEEGIVLAFQICSWFTITS